MKPDDYYVVYEHNGPELIGAFSNFSAAKRACVTFAKKHEPDVVEELEFGIYKVELTKKNRVKTYTAEFSGIELSEVSNENY